MQKKLNAIFKSDKDKSERVFYADIKTAFRKKYIFFGKYYANLEIDLTSLNPMPMNREDAEFTSKLAYLSFRRYGLLRVELQEVKEENET